MDELNDDAKALLARARPAFTPSAEELARLRTRLDVPTPPDDGGTAQEGGTSTARRWAWRGVGLAAAGVVVTAAWLARDPPPTTGAPLAEVHAPAQEVRAERVHANDAMPMEAPRGAAPPPAAATTGDAAPLERPRPARVRDHHAQDPRPDDPPAAVDDAFAEELALVVAARRALGRDAFAEAADAAARYRERFPDGAFAEEAEVLHILAGCGLGRDDATIARAREYVGDRASAFAKRVRRACLDDAAGDSFE